MRLISVILFIFFSTSCASTRPGANYIDDLNLPLNELQKTVLSSLPLGKRNVSVNQREYFSDYFTEENGEYTDARDAKIRKFAHITILGDRRPYTLEIVVLVQRRGQSGDYSTIAADQATSRVIMRRIQNTLHKRREDRNIIDEFRVF